MQEAHFQAMEAQLVAASIALALEAGFFFNGPAVSNLVLRSRLRRLTVINPFQETLVQGGGV